MAPRMGRLPGTPASPAPTPLRTAAVWRPTPGCRPRTRGRAGNTNAGAALPATTTPRGQRIVGQ
eukprot:7618932-Lingulodinium_polyedra.AAC.1